MLDPIRKEPMSGERKEHFEALRKNNVPRYLFRAWSPSSGGGAASKINTASVIIPHAFMPAYQTQTEIENFYQYNENELHSLAAAHYGGASHPPSVFSFWAASLHLVLCYAKSMSAKSTAYVAVIDTKLLESEVLVWHVPHLLGSGNHEYLAYGIIKGKGYKTVQLQELEQHGLLSIFKELPRANHFGHDLRHSMFYPPPVEINGGERNIIMALAPRFGNLALPVALALMHIRPRPAMIPEFDCGTLEGLVEAQNFVESVLKHLGISEIPPELHTEPWLAPGAVNTSGFLDVKEWIKTLSDLSKLDAFVRATKEEGGKSSLELSTVIEAPKQPNKKRKRDKDADAQEKEALAVSKRLATLRPRKTIRRD